MTQVPRRVLVFGASGYVGSNLVPHLVQAGHSVRAAARRGRVLQARGWDGVELVAADALRPETLGPALVGIDTAYYLVHSMAAGRDFGRLDVAAAGHFADAAARAGVRRIVYLGGLVPPDAASEHLLSRRQTGARLRAGPVAVTEVRAGIIVGPGSAAFEVIRDLVNASPVIMAPKWVRSKSAPIGLDDLLHDLLAVADMEAAAGAVLDAAGPDYISYEAMMRGFAAAVGRRLFVLPVPWLTPWLSSHGLFLVTSVPTKVARALIAGLTLDIPADTQALRRLVPRPLLGYHEQVRAALAAEQNGPAAARWTEGLMMFRGGRQENAYYARRAGATAHTAASPRAIWDVVAAIGGANGYFYMNALWDIRAVLDWMVGGPGMTKARPEDGTMRPGDHIDSWTVLAVQPERSLTLGFGMRAPGAGVLEFEIIPHDNGRNALSVTAYWHPRGVWGLTYWFAMMPAHLVLFEGMAREIVRRAEAAEAVAATVPA